MLVATPQASRPSRFLWRWKNCGGDRPRPHCRHSRNSMWKVKPSSSFLLARARKLKIKARFALRVNPDVFAETHPYISTGLREHKFGIDIRQAARIYKSAAGNRWLEPHGVSVHIGSQIRSAAPVWRRNGAGKEAGGQLRREGIALNAIDAGGGLGIDYHGLASFDARAAKVAEYAAAIEDALGRFRRAAAARAGPLYRCTGRRIGGARIAGEAQWQERRSSSPMPR